VAEFRPQGQATARWIGVRSTLSVTGMLPRVALEWGQCSSARTINSAALATKGVGHADPESPAIRVTLVVPGPQGREGEADLPGNQRTTATGQWACATTC